MSIGDIIAVIWTVVGVVGSITLAILRWKLNQESGKTTLAWGELNENQRQTLETLCAGIEDEELLRSTKDEFIRLVYSGGKQDYFQTGLSCVSTLFVCGAVATIAVVYYYLQ